MAFAWLSGLTSSVFRYSLVGEANPKEFKLEDGSHVKKILSTKEHVIIALEKTFRRIDILKELVEPKMIQFSSESSNFGDFALSPDQKALISVSQSSSELLVADIDSWRMLQSSSHKLDHSVKI